jgi:ribonuclease VapC
VTIDTSAVIAILFDEAERQEFNTRIVDAERKLISAVSVLEATIVLESRNRDNTSDLDLFLLRSGITVVPFDGDQLAFARTAFRRFGKGRHPAALNFGDCAAYALAQWSGEPLLFKGTHFASTDVPRAR